MMKRIIIILVLNIPIILLPYQINAQTKLQGKIIVLYTKISPKPAQITANGEATDTEVFSDGTFELVFQFKKPGDEVSISVLKEDYEVVNKQELTIILRNNASLQSIPIIRIAKIGEYAKLKNRIYTNSLSKYKGPQTKEVIENAESYASMLSTIDERVDDSQLFKIRELVEKGKINEATKIIDPNQSIKLIQKEKLNINKAKTNITENSQIIVNSSNIISNERRKLIATAKNNFFINNISEAKKILELLYNEDSTNKEVVIEIADFNAIINNYSRSEYYYYKALKLDISNNEKAKILSALINANLYIESKKNIIFYVNQAADLLNTTFNISVYLKAELNQIIGSYYTNEKNIDSGIFYLNRSLLISNLYSNNTAWALLRTEIFMGLENISFQENDSIGFEEINSKLLYECNNIQNNSIKIVKLSEIYFNNGIFYHKYKNKIKSYIEFSKASKIQDSLYKLNPLSFGLSYSRILYNLALSTEDKQLKENLLIKSINTIYKTYKNDPATFKVIYFEYNKNYCYSKANYSNNKMLDSSCKCALTLLDTVNLDNNFESNKDAIELLNRIGYNYLILNNLLNAEIYFTKSLQLLSKIIDSTKSKYYYELKYSNQLNLFEIYRIGSPFRIADSMLVEASNTSTLIDTPRIYKNIIDANLLYCRGILLDQSLVNSFKFFAYQNILDAIEIFSNSISYLNAKYLITYSKCLLFAGKYNINTNTLLATNYFKKSEVILDSLNRTEKYKYAYDYATLLFELSKLYNNDSSCKNAIKYLEKVKSVIDSNFNIFKENNIFLYEINEFYGDVRLLSENTQGAKKCYLEAIKYCKKEKRNLDITRILNKIPQIKLQHQ